MIIIQSTSEEMKEKIKTMLHPIFNILSNSEGDFVRLKNHKDVVEYRFRGNIDECINLLMCLDKKRNEK